MSRPKPKPVTAEIVPLEPRRPLTPKQERFARLYVQTGNASEAYRQSYDAENMQAETIHVRACEMLKDGKITVRVAEIEAEALAATNLTLGRLVSEGLNLLESAKEQGDVRAATAVLATLGRFHERMSPDPQADQGKSGSVVAEIMATINGKGRGLPGTNGGSIQPETRIVKVVVVDPESEAS